MDTITKKVYPVLNMHCAGCANNVEKTVRKLAGVADASVSLASNLLNVAFDEGLVTPGEIRAAVLAAGYDLIVEEDHKAERQEEAQRQRYHSLKQKVIGAWAFAVPLLVLSMALPHAPYTDWAQLVLAVPVLALFGRDFFTGAWKQLQLRRSNMDTLVALSTSIAFLFSLFNTLFPQYWQSHGLEAHVYYEASAVIIAFVLTGKLMEERAKVGTSTAIRKLMGLQPRTARVRRTDKEEDVPIADLRVGDLVVVHPGERVPVDGRVVEGESYVDESMISGEPVAVGKMKDDKILAGTVNQRGALVARATQVGDQTLLAHIIKLVQEAQGSKAPVQRIVDRVTEFFVPAVLAISILTLVLWLLIGGTDALSHALLSAVSVLVIACPCALGLATPTALMVGIGKAADNHILIKDAVALEQMRKVDVAVFDKTGTLTEGAPTVTGWLWALSEQSHYKEVLLAAELKSEHPLAGAIAEALRVDDTEMLPASLDSFESLTGKGVKVTYQGQTYWVGSHKLLNDFHAPVPERMGAMLMEYASEGNGIIYFGRESDLLGAIAVSDPIKATTAEALKQLKAQGVEVCMLTGDGERTAKAVATRLNVDRYMSDAMPDDKADFIRELQLQGKTVAMVGDGINDSQALALADVSVAMGKGTDIAMDVAMVTLMTSDLLLLPKAFQLSRQTVRLINQNLFWAFIYNLIGIPIAAGILYPINGLLLSPMLASAAMAFSSVSVVLNSLSLGRR
ncbi:MAG: heavy metal translocating P-type ATPase [Mediterranea sp.]|jgi:Cu2+-exporting ATPase|nr:heavy metal translocating P-type ATPase [Mediterranea sp.]